MDLEKIREKEVLILVSISLVIGLLLGAAVYHLSMGNVSEDEASEMVQSAFEAQGVNVSVASVETESPSIYRVIIESGNGLQNVFVSKDGQYILNNPVNADEFTQTVSAQYEFNQCLSRNNVTVIGSSAQQATQQQLKTLGTAGLGNVYLEANQQLAQQLNQSGVQNLPVTSYNGEFYQGVQTREFYSELTGCSLEN